MSNPTPKFKKGDSINIKYQDGNYNAYIPKRHIAAMMNLNPHLIKRIVYATWNSDGTKYIRYNLETDGYNWPEELLDLDAPKTPDWII